MTAPSNRQLRDILWAEVEKAYKIAPDIIGGHKTLQRLEMGADHFLEAFKSEDYDISAFAGFHSANIMIIMDEASGIKKDIWTATGGIKTGKVVKHIVAGQPYDPNSEFAKCFKNPNWYKLHYSSYESPNITGEIEIDGLADEKWINDRITDGWTKDSQLYRIRVLGEFPEEGGPNTLIPLTKLQEAIERKRAISGPLVMGIDVARFGNDKTVFVIMDETGKEVDVIEVNKLDTMEIVGKTINIINKYDIESVGVDVIGLGAGVYDRLKELLGTKAIPVNVSMASSSGSPVKWKYSRQAREMKYLNLRAELYWMLKENIDILCILDKGRTVADLADVRYKFRSNGSIQIESKEDCKKRTGRSLDFADARIIALYTASKVGQSIKIRDKFIQSEAVSGLV